MPEDSPDNLLIINTAKIYYSLFIVHYLLSYQSVGAVTLRTLPPTLFF